MPLPAVAVILAWGAAIVAGALGLKLVGGTVEKLAEEVGDVVKETGETVRDVSETVRDTTGKVFRPEVLILLVVGLALYMGIIPKFKR